MSLISKLKSSINGKKLKLKRSKFLNNKDIKNIGAKYEKNIENNPSEKSMRDLNRIWKGLEKAIGIDIFAYKESREDNLDPLKNASIICKSLLSCTTITTQSVIPNLKKALEKLKEVKNWKNNKNDFFGDAKIQAEFKKIRQVLQEHLYDLEHLDNTDNNPEIKKSRKQFEIALINLGKNYKSTDKLEDQFDRDIKRLNKALRKIEPLEKDKTYFKNLIDLVTMANKKQKNYITTFFYGLEQVILNHFRVQNNENSNDVLNSTSPVLKSLKDTFNNHKLAATKAAKN